MAQPNSHTNTNVILNSVYAAGTSSRVSGNATVLPNGVVYAAASVRAPVVRASTSFSSPSVTGSTSVTGGTGSFTTVTASTGYTFVGGAVKRFAAGTYIGTGGATAALVVTGLASIRQVFMQLNKQAYSAATTGMAYGRPCRAAGTPGSFYPIAFKLTGAPGPVLNTVAGTFMWEAIGG